MRMTWNDIKAGMILLTPPKTTEGQLIVDAQNLHHAPEHQRNFSHAAVVLGSPTGLQIVESTLPVVRQTTLSYWLAENGPEIHAAVLWDWWPWEAEEDERAWRFVLPLLEQPYNVAGLLLMALWELSNQTLPPVPQIAGKVCSVLAVGVIQAGLELCKGDTDWRDPNGVDPNTIPEMPWVSKTVLLERGE
jgi:hypothetical protein